MTSRAKNTDVELTTAIRTLGSGSVGDTISAEFEVAEKRDLESREDAGLVVIDALTTNQGGENVFEGDMKFMFKKQSHYGDE